MIQVSTWITVIEVSRFFYYAYFKNSISKSTFSKGVASLTDKTKTWLKRLARKN